MWTEGNAAKVYCLDWIAGFVSRASGAASILDLGCGTGRNFVKLLAAFPQVRYVGVEPSREGCAAARDLLPPAQATIVQALAYGYRADPVDIVVSFSVLEHVYDRRRYLQAVHDNLAPDGRALINYDAGHFRGAVSWRDRAKNVAGPLLARFGHERYYQSLVREREVHDHLARVGLAVEEDRVFNTGLKAVYPLVPPEHRSQFQERWLELELFVNEAGVRYRDDLAGVFSTRNFLLRRADAHAGGSSLAR